MADREKLIREIQYCTKDCADPGEDECNPGKCRYAVYQNSYDYDCKEMLLKDALTLLREQEPRVIELSEISPNIYVWVEDRDDGTVFPLKGGVIDPDGDDYFRFDADFGEDFVYYPTGPFGKSWRVWDKCPSPEQMRDTPWEGEKA